MNRFKQGIVTGLAVAATLAWSPSVGAEPTDKVTICHATSSDSNPYVEVTASRNAIYGQAGHFSEPGSPNAGHEEDLEAPCPTTPTTTESPTTTPTTEAPTNTVDGDTPTQPGDGETPVMPAQPDPKVTICHATSSDSNPYVEVTASRNAIYGQAGHFNEPGSPNAGHEDDLEGPCPTTPTTTETPTTTPTTEAPTNTVDGDTPTEPDDGDTPTEPDDGDTPTEPGDGETPVVPARPDPTGSTPDGVVGGDGGDNPTPGDTGTDPDGTDGGNIPTDGVTGTPAPTPNNPVVAGDGGPAPTGSTTGTPTGTLPSTGAEPNAIMAIGALLLALGGAAFAVARRRNPITAA